MILEVTEREEDDREAFARAFLFDSCHKKDDQIRAFGSKNPLAEPIKTLVTPKFS